MTRFNGKLVSVCLLVILIVSPALVQADEIPQYSASPSASEVANATCTLKATRGSGNYAPTDVSFEAESVVNGQKVEQFTYDFGDGTISTGSGALSHRYSQAGTYEVTAQPVVDENLKVNPCKMTITLKAFPFTSQSASPTPTPEPSASPSATPVATSSAVITQPETGPASIYWLSLAGLLTIWLGAELWYLHNHRMIG